LIEEPLTDEERQLLVILVMAQIPRDHGDPHLTRLVAKLSGSDTQLVARRAYPSKRHQQRSPHAVRTLCRR
jgi:hypothetical protein